MNMRNIAHFATLMLLTRVWHREPVWLWQLGEDKDLDVDGLEQALQHMTLRNLQESGQVPEDMSYEELRDLLILDKSLISDKDKRRVIWNSEFDTELRAKQFLDSIGAPRGMTVGTMLRHSTPPKWTCSCGYPVSEESKQEARDSWKDFKF